MSSEMLSNISSKKILAKRKVEEIYKESESNFNCRNYQWIAERLEDAFIDLHEFAVFPKIDQEKKLKEQRNLAILSQVLKGARYKDLRLQYNITSEAGIATIAKVTACKLSKHVANEISLGGSPQRIMRSFDRHLFQRISEREKELANV